jgi:predicted Zn finger-like uncharacterized protein
VQAPCPQCGTKISIDDAKVPDRPFQVKCPKCQTAVRFPGKAAPEAAPVEAAAGPASTEEMKVQMMAQLRREISMGEGTHAGGRALVGVSDKAVAGAATLTLTRQGYQVDTLDNGPEGARLMEQGVYELVLTSRAAGAPGKETLYQSLSRLNPDGRRRLFVVLVGDEFKTGDGTQAFACLADLVVHTKDVASADAVLRNTIAEKGRVYQAFIDAKRRHESSAGA